MVEGGSGDETNSKTLSPFERRMTKKGPQFFGEKIGWHNESAGLGDTNLSDATVSKPDKPHDQL